jgi:hypothetical protein
MKTTTFTGSYYEIGLQQGEVYRYNGMNFEDLVIDQDLFRSQLEVYKYHNHRTKYCRA